MFKSIKVLSKEDCIKATDIIYNLSKYQVKVADNSEITTLGAASYLHGHIYTKVDEEIDFNKKIGSDTDFAEEDYILPEEESDAYYPLHMVCSDEKSSKQKKQMDEVVIDPIENYACNYIAERFYDKLKKITNPVLISNFEWMYDKISSAIEQELNEKCLINEDADLAYPGFNILLPHDNCTKIDGPPHIDLQWTYHIDALKRFFDLVEENRFLTFTLAVKIPKSGAGLYIWEGSDNDISNYKNAKKYYHDVIVRSKRILKDNDNLVDKDIFEKELNPKIINYEEGYMTLFDNLLLHQVMPFNTPFSKDESRITLQGHAIKCDNIWRLFF